MAEELFHELCEKLQLLDEVTLLEVLNLTSADLVEVFWDKILDDQDRIRSFFEEEDGESD